MSDECSIGDRFLMDSKCSCRPLIVRFLPEHWVQCSDDMTDTLGRILKKGMSLEVLHVRSPVFEYDRQGRMINSNWSYMSSIQVRGPDNEYNGCINKDVRSLKINNSFFPYFYP